MLELYLESPIHLTKIWRENVKTSLGQGPVASEKGVEYFNSREVRNICWLNIFYVLWICLVKYVKTAVHLSFFGRATEDAHEISVIKIEEKVHHPGRE